MVAPSVHISNIKLSFKAKINCSILKQFIFVNNRNSIYIHRPKTNSFFLFKLLKHQTQKIIFTVYYKGHINVTGIKSYKEIVQIKKVLLLIPGIKQLYNYTVDNITATGNLYHSFFHYPFSKVLHTIINNKAIEQYSIKYSPQTFPGAFIKIKNNRGTCVLFPSGKFNILGCQNKEQIDFIVTKIKKSLHNYLSR